MKKLFILLFSIATAICISANEPKGNVAYASYALKNVSGLDNPTAMSKVDEEKFKAEFAYEMAKITAKIVAAPNTNVEKFKMEFAYATAQVTAKIMPILPSSSRNQFAYEMALITTKMLSDQNLDIEKSKAEFAYEIAQLTTKIITNSDSTSKTHNPSLDQAALRNNADIEKKTTGILKPTDTDKKTIVNPGYIAPETYNGLINELKQVGNRSKQSNNKVNIDGEVRLHYALNSGSAQWDGDSSAIRVRLGFDTAINKDWQINGMLEGQKRLVNSSDEFKLARLNVSGKLGESMVRAGSFGYLMAEGNIYDSGFKGVRLDLGESVKYTLSYGETDYTKETAIATVRYTDFDYNLEAGVYHFQMDDSVRNKNTIWTLGGNYSFNDFSVGAMYLGSSSTDSKGYVLSLNHGDLKTYRPGTYDVFAKYYNQPRGTYIVHGMNGLGGWMQGFKGYGLGTHYTFAENFVGGLEYYDLTDKILGNQGNTWWSQLSYYF